MFAHGFNIHFCESTPKDVDVFMVAKGPGHLVAILRGGGFLRVRVHRRRAKPTARRSAGRVRRDRNHLGETETDLFGEQASCGGVTSDQGRFRNAGRCRLSSPKSPI
ncbi:MAG: hypothetical protein ACLTTU_11100 [Bilophila wadsworthia]